MGNDINFGLLLIVVLLTAGYYIVLFDKEDSHKFFDNYDLREGEIMLGIRCTLFSFTAAMVTVLYYHWVVDMTTLVIKILE